ncbi:MAG: YlbF family regulator [Oscillospiraceae bacterium]|jgi:cell fate (sporulation/competence/biofilm development) regulator YlbF (YheA/YmcA/DUF963 family)|nr:YlbF family regulator [Oscillospiraceae bacterium]
MNIIDATRDLGRTLQGDARYTRLQEATAKCDQDKELQDMIGNFNLLRMNLNAEMQKEPQDTEKVNQMKAELQAAYDKTMARPSMSQYTVAQKEMQDLLNRMYGILNQCAQGADPATADYNPCTHDCSTCGGSCH